MGLGLTIVKTFTQNYGGNIKIQSKEGLGTSIRLFLPLNNKTTDTEKNSGANQAATILVVDDNAEIVEGIKTSLEAVGNTVHAVTGADAALEIYKKYLDQINVVVIDLIMPEKDGKYLFDSITKINPEVSVIIMSGFSRNYVRDYMTNSKWWFAQKPINSEYLIATIERILK